MFHQIIVPSEGLHSRRAAAGLQDYLQKVCGRSIPVVSDQTGPHGDAVVIGDASRNRWSSRLGFSRDWSGIRPDGYALRTIRRNGQNFVVAAGCTELGDQQAIHRLVRELAVQGKRCEVGDLDIVASPFLKTREVIMSDACPWDPYEPEDQVPQEQRAMTYDSIFKTDAYRLNCSSDDWRNEKRVGLRRVVEKHCIENWSHSKLAKYVDQMHWYGFNSIQFCDNDESYLHSGCLVSRREYREKLLAMMRRARELGIRNSLSVLGGNVQLANGIRVISDWDDPLCDERVHFNYPLNVKASSCWQEEEGRRAIDAQLHYLAGYAPYIDHIFSHFVDPGGCNRNGCTIGTCMTLMNHHQRLFRQVNPQIKATFNTWPLTSNQTGFRTCDTYRRSSWNRTYTWWHFLQVVDLLEEDIMIASRKYNPEVAELCRRWKRPYGLWRWYSSDQEITAALHVEAERLGREFAAMPPEAADLEYCSMPSCCHGLNSASLYITARLMWEPKLAPFALLREFCEMVFGPQLAKAAYDGYAAIACIRNHDVDGDSAFDDSYLGAGTFNPHRDAEISGQALANLSQLGVDETWVSKIPMAVSRQEMMEDLKDHLTMVHQYAVFRTAMQKLIRQERISPADWRNLPKVNKLRVSGGMIEWRKYIDVMRLGTEAGGVPGGDDT